MVNRFSSLTVNNVQCRKRGKVLLGPLDFHTDTPGVTLVMGPNGSGKTTLLRLIHGLERPKSGSICWTGKEHALELTQSFIFQEPILLRRSVLDNLQYPLKLNGTAKQERIEKSLEACTEIGLEHAKDRDAHSLSGGEKQKLALARALITGPQVVLLDEPAASLDGQSTLEIEKMLEAAAARGTKLFLATHDLGQAKRLGSEVLFLNKGQLVEHTVADAFFNNPKTDAARKYLSGEILL